MNILLKINNSTSRVGFIVFILLLIFFINIFSLKVVNKKIYVWKEAENADELIDGLDIKSDEEASNKKGIISNIISHSVRSYAKYNIYISEPGQYKFWARCRWNGACSNCFLVKMDNANRNIFGEDPIYDKWIWSEGLVYDLSKGNHVFYVWNEENQSEMDKLLFTSDLSNKPSGLGLFNTFSINFEFEDQVSLFIRKYSKNWEIINTDVSIDKLLFQPEDILKPSIIAKKFSDKEDYFNSDMRFYLPLDLKMKIDNGNFNSVSSPEISNLLNAIIQSDDFLQAKDRNLSKFNSNIEKINYKRNVIIDNFQYELASNIEKYFNRVLFMKSSDNQTVDYVKIDSKSPENYIILFKYKFGNPSFNTKNLSVLFNIQDENNCYNLEFKNESVYLYKRQKGNVNQLGISKFEYPENNISFNSVTIIRDFPNIIIKHNRNTILSATDSSYSSGSMAIGSLSGGVYIDDIQQLTSFDVNYQQNFFGHELFAEGNYCINNGYWYQTGENENYLVGKRNDKLDAKMTFGFDYWKNYLVQCAVNFKNGSSAGILFNVQDSDNYYQFRWLQRNNNSSVLQLLKVKDGITEVLDEKINNYSSHFWHKIMIKSFNGNLSVLIHDNVELQAQDNIFMNGYVGFWTDSEQEIAIDDIDIHSINSLQENEQNEIKYTFSDRSNVSLELCDWISNGNMSYEDYFGMNELSNKKMFEKHCFINRKKFTGDIKVIFSHFYEKYGLEYSPLNVDGIMPFLTFNCYNGKNINTYVYRIENDAAVLYMNEKEIERVKINSKNSYGISAQYQNNSLSFVHNRKDTLHYNPNNNFDYYQLGFGYDGIGFLNRINSRIQILKNL